MTLKHDIAVRRTCSILDALHVIDKIGLQIAIVVNDDGVVCGTISDGDVRRAILNGIPLTAKIDGVYNREPLIAQEGEFKDRIRAKAHKAGVFIVPVVDETGCLVSLEEFHDVARAQPLPNCAVLMAGGLGSRLRPLTDSIPKPMLPVAGRPLLQRIIENLKLHGFEKIILSVNYLAEQIEDYFGDGSDFDVNITYVRETKRMGTAGSLSLMEQYLTEPFLVMNGDLLTDLNFRQLRDSHALSEASATMVVRNHSIEVPFGVVSLNDADVVGMLEKPTEDFCVNAGIYMLNPSCLDVLPRGDYFDMPMLISELLNQQKRVASFPIREYWLDIGRAEDFEKAQTSPLAD